MRVTNEIKAGIVIIIAVAVGIMFFAKTATFRQETYEIKTYFGYAGNLKPNADVTLAGIQVGRIKEIKFLYDPATRIECIIEIDEYAKVRTDSLAYIGSAGFVGDTHVGLTAGSSDEFVKPGDTIKSEDPLQTRLLMKKAEDIANNLDKILVEVKSIVVDNRKNIDDIVINI